MFNEGPSETFSPSQAPQQCFPNPSTHYSAKSDTDATAEQFPAFYNYNMCASSSMAYQQLNPYGMYWWPQHDQTGYYAMISPQMNGFAGASECVPIPITMIPSSMEKPTTAKPKGGRVPYSAEQLAILRRRFEQNDRIEIKERTELSKIIGLTPHQIKVWFQNRRFKVRREQEKLLRKTTDEIDEKLQKCESFTSAESSQISPNSNYISETILSPMVNIQHYYVPTECDP
ncbi:unnamed protein product [Caenorhabditis bovis]|uniref:Homeobox domain-containing protein n=1 Tax=Caenorhabditis bovis TaxID=2654633 RepID=A0A8S1E9D8_9PELO|nr:unnamed protein product [Caenorhabditis bovis]